MVSRSSIEAEVVSLEISTRMDGILALILCEENLDIVLSIFFLFVGGNYKYSSPLTLLYLPSLLNRFSTIDKRCTYLPMLFALHEEYHT